MPSIVESNIFYPSSSDRFLGSRPQEDFCYVQRFRCPRPSVLVFPPSLRAISWMSFTFLSSRFPFPCTVLDFPGLSLRCTWASTAPCFLFTFYTRYSIALSFFQHLRPLISVFSSCFRTPLYFLLCLSLAAVLTHISLLHQERCHCLIIPFVPLLTTSLLLRLVVPWQRSSCMLLLRYVAHSLVD